MKKFFEIIKNKWLIKGTSTLILIAIIIACYIILNMLVKKINIEDLDFTEKKLYSLSEETKSKISGLNNDITIQIINMANEEYVKEYARKYSSINKKISVEEIDDVSSRVDLKTNYQLEGSEGIIVVKSDEKEKTISKSDLTTYDYSTYKQIDRTEEAITNAIVEITLDKKPKIYIFSGKTYDNPETSLASVISKLKEDANDVEMLDILSKGSIPEDCDALVITTLKEDLSELEKDKILEYINKGGKLFILTSQNLITTDTPNFDAVLSQYGINIEFGAIFEQDTAKMLSGAPEFVITDVTASFMSDIDMAIKMCLIDGGKINFADESKLKELGVEYEKVATTGSTAYIRTNFNINSPARTAQDGPEEEIIVGAKVKKKIDDEKSSELIIYSNEQFSSNMQVPVSNQYYIYAIDLYNNKDVVLNSIAYLTERKDTITIRKTDETENYTVTEKQNVIIRIIIFVTPAVIIIAGIVVWQIRRRRK